ncbi:MAG: peptidylprolyl isomerase [Dehalococcoidales bacterium]
MAKKRLEKPRREVTKRQLSRWQQQKRRQRFILGLGISIILAVIGLISAGVYFGWYLTEYKPLQEIVIEVNDTRFDMDYYIKSLEFHSAGQTQYLQFFLDSVVGSIEQNELIKQGALGLGISIADDKVDAELKDGDLPDNQAVRDILRTQLLLTELREAYFEPGVPLTASQRQIMAMFLESQSQADEVTARLEAGEDFAQLAGELSLDSLTRESNGDLGWRPQGVLTGLLNTSVLSIYVFGFQVGVLSQPIYDEEKTKGLGYWLIEVLERREVPQEARVQAMLLASEEEAQSVKARLEDGEDFAQLAGELSQLLGAEDNKGDLGWLATGTMSQGFDEFVFDSETELNTVSNAIRDESATTTGGYWLFKVVANDTRELADEDRELLVSRALDDWLSSILDDPKNRLVSYLDDEMKAFATDRVLGG